MMRRKNRRPPHEYVVALVLLFAIVWLSFMLFAIFQKEEIARRAARDARAELASLELREQTLAKNVADLATERGQEATLRQTYGVARPGEEVIIVVEPEEQRPLQALSWWDRFMGWLGM